MRTTLKDIRRRALALADEQEPTSGVEDAIDTEELLDVLNEGLGDLQDHMAAVDPGALETRTLLPAVAGQDWLELPADVLDVIDVFALRGSKRTRLSRFYRDELDGATSTQTSTYPAWRVAGPRIWFSPAPSAGLQVEIWHVRGLTKLTTDSSTLPPEVSEAGERYLVGYVAAYIFDKMETDPTPAEKRMARALEVLQVQAVRRGGPTEVRTPATAARYRKTSFADRVSRLPRS